MKAKRRYTFEPDYAVAPGATLKEVIESLCMKQKELALRTGLTEQTIIRIFSGEQPITHDTATKLEMVTSVPARVWNNLEMNYREQLSKLKFQQQLQGYESWLSTIPIKDLKERGILTETDEPSEIVQEVLLFYGVSSIDAWKSLWSNPKVAARLASQFTCLAGPASAWIRMGELQAREIECTPFNASTFSDAIQAIRKLTTKKPKEVIPQICTLCSEAGVALVLVPHWQQIPWKGASKWLSPEKALIVLNLKDKKDDTFWLSFFHEAYHIRKGRKKQLYIADSSKTDKEELKAAAFALSMRIPF